MQRLFLLIAVSGLLIAPLAADQNGVIGGVVRNGWSKAPIKRAIVTLRTTGPDILEALTYSEPSGAFAFTGVPPGDYTLCARLEGYERACFGGSTEAGRPTPLFTLAPGQLKQDVILAMLPTGSVSGTVMDSEGDPLPNANIQLVRPVYSRRTLHWQMAAQATSNDKGEYHLTFVQPGEYRVMATAPFQQAMRVRPEAVAGQTVQEEMYLPQFYPGVSTIDAAAPLTLNAGNDLKGIDFTLSTTPQVTVGGVVHPPQGMEKDAYVSIQMSPESRIGTEPNVGFGAAPPDYTFQANVAAGRYHVTAFAEVGDHIFGADQWVDTGSGADSISLHLTAGTPLTGRLIVEGESIRQHGPYTVRLTPEDQTRFNGRTPSAEVSDSGVFEFPSVLPGIWDIGLSPRPPGSYLKSMTLGDQDVLTKDMKLEDGTRKTLTIVLSTKGGVVSGNVMLPDASGPVTRSRPRLLLAPTGKAQNVLSFYETTLADAKGHFEFKGVTPGAYRIYAFDRLQVDEYWKPDFLKPFTAQAGDTFDVGEGARLTHDATLIVRDAGGTE